jgi:hypothetical protein
MEDRIRDILATLEDAISYEDLSLVEDARKELLFLLDEMESDFPTFEEDF